MPYFQELNILFIHIPKTGGTSIENYFCDKLNISRKKNLHRLFGVVKRCGIAYPLQHCTINDISKILPTINLDTTKIMTIVRNPYHRILSALFWRKCINTNSNQMQVQFQIQLFLQSSHWDNHNWPQYLFLIKDGKINDNIIIMKTETLQEQMQNYGYDDFDKNNNVTHRNKIDYMTFLSDFSKKIIYDFYEQDFILFGYEP